MIKTKGGDDMKMTTADIATELATTPRTLRKFLRSEGRGVGKGARYALPGSKREVAALAKRFTAWDEARKATQDANDE
jgi:predicted transcriptional regulator